MIKFENPEDGKYFSQLLCKRGERISKYKLLFDFCDPSIKRKEFNKIRNSIVTRFLKLNGLVCGIAFDKICDINSGINIDHIIPLSTNKLNKELRNMNSLKGKKVKTQSFGSNNIKNLILTCRKCNAHKKHKILTKREIRKILNKKFITGK